MILDCNKFRFIGIKIYNLTERINQEGASAPCRYANEKMAPLKEELKDREIVYIYIASESSPKETWENMIADLKGEHYRLNERQSGYLMKVFGVEGVPTYLIVDPEGNICWKKTGFSGSETIKTELLKALGE